jgi:hypothetical protein
MAEAMDTCVRPRGVPFTRLHMLRGLDYAGGPYPFYSADSHERRPQPRRDERRAARKSALRMARRSTRFRPRRAGIA